MKKILVVCQHFWPENFRINDICQGLIEKGIEIDVLCGIPNYPKGKFFKGYSYFKNRKQIINNMHIRRVFEIPRKGNSNIMIFLNYISFPFFSLFHLPRLLFKKYDKIFLYQLSPVLMSLTGILLGKIKKIPTIMYVLDLWPENFFSVIPIKNKLLRKILYAVSHWHYRNVSKIIAISQKMKEILTPITGFSEEKIIFIPQCCEKLYEKEIIAPEIQSRFKNTFNLIYTGNISPAQSFETIISAAKMIKNSGISDIHWIIVGDGMSREKVQQEILASGLEKFFTFEGQKPMAEIPKYTYIADGLIACLADSALLDCTIPAKVLSYFAAGRPILLAMNGEAQDIVKDSQCGFAGDAGNAKELYHNILKLYNLSKEERRLMGKRAKEYHFSHFERNTNFEKLYHFIFDNQKENQ